MELEERKRGRDRDRKRNEEEEEMKEEKKEEGEEKKKGGRKNFHNEVLQQLISKMIFHSKIYTFKTSQL